MPRDPRFDVMFGPVRIGPVTAPNRFYQVPHCTGIGYRKPQTLAALRETKAEGGWGTVCTEYCSIHPSSDDDPYPSATIWDNEDIRSMELMVDRVHSHGALAGIELWHGGAASANHYSREVPIGPSSRPAGVWDPVQTMAMDKDDIQLLKKWHLDAARRARRAGFDIVYVYACHWYLLKQFLEPANRRTDEYGGTLENRVRLLRELLEETKAEIGDDCAIAVRFSASSGGPDDAQDTEEPRQVIEMLKDLPDLWDITVHDYSYEMGTSRFVPEAGLEQTMSWVKQVTHKPVVSVGRFTSPETMLRLVRQGVVDLIGAARPSIADPFLPNKIAEGREDDIRECIGCNICYSGDQTGTPIRCTQNPTMGEEWRKGWHPEVIPARGSNSNIVIVGGGPAGLEAAVALGRRGYDVVLAEARRELGGRVTLESNLPGMAEYARVRDWRLTQLDKLPNVEWYLESVVDRDQLHEFGADRIIVATGATWRHDGTGRWLEDPVPGWNRDSVITPDDVMAGFVPDGPVVVFDDDHYYMGGVIAERLRESGHPVTLITPANAVATWTSHTEEQFRIQQQLLLRGIDIRTAVSLTEVVAGEAVAECIYTGRREHIAANHVVMVTSRRPNDTLYQSLEPHVKANRIGDCAAPGTIATAVYSGHRVAREMDARAGAPVSFVRERATAPGRPR